MGQTGLYSRFRRVAAAVVAVFAVSFVAVADSEDVVFDPDQVSFDEFVQHPEVPKKSKSYITEFMHNEARKLAQLNYEVETMRHGEVVIVTIPTDRVFQPNDTVMTADADSQLRNLLAYTSVPDKYKIIFKVHTDDTGSELYLYNLSVGRTNAIYEYFDARAQSSDDLFGYPMGGEEPRNPNDSRQHRMSNRRIEFFIMPGDKLISQAKK